LPPAFTLVSFTAYSSILKIEAICSSETSVDFQRIVLFIPTVVRTSDPAEITERVVKQRKELPQEYLPFNVILIW
jgi:hypothetical protein